MVPEQSGRRSIRHAIRLWLALAGLAVLIVFTLQNTEAVDIDLLFWTFTASGAILVFVVAAIGIAIGWLLRSARGPDGFSLFGYSRPRGSP